MQFSFLVTRNDIKRDCFKFQASLHAFFSIHLVRRPVSFIFCGVLLYLLLAPWWKFPLCCLNVVEFKTLSWFLQNLFVGWIKYVSAVMQWCYEWYISWICMRRGLVYSSFPQMSFSIRSVICTSYFDECTLYI